MMWCLLPSIPIFTAPEFSGDLVDSERLRHSCGQSGVVLCLAVCVMWSRDGVSSLKEETLDALSGEADRLNVQLSPSGARSATATSPLRAESSRRKNGKGRNGLITNYLFKLHSSLLT